MRRGLYWHCFRCDETIAWKERCPECRRSRGTGLLSDEEKPSDAPTQAPNREENQA